MSGPGLEEAVASVLEERTGRHCLFVPSGRLALYLALRTWLWPGDRILICPLDDDVILFVVLTAADQSIAGSSWPPAPRSRAPRAETEMGDTGWRRRSACASRRSGSASQLTTRIERLQGSEGDRQAR